MSTTTVATKKELENKPFYLDTGETSGSFKLSVSFPAEYIMVLNNTLATIAVSIGEQSSQTPDAQIWTPGQNISLPLIQETQKLTVFWTSDSPIAVGQNLVQFYFSNVTIPIHGGNYGESSSSQIVQVDNTVTTQFATPQNVNVESMPSQGLTAGVSQSSQVTVGLVATALINGVVNAKTIRIKNIDATNSIFIGSSNVTGTSGYPLSPGGEFDIDIVSGSTISLYGIATAGTPKAAIIELN